MSKQIEPHISNLYQIEKLLGSGAYGHVWKVIEKKSKRVLALKKIFDAFQNSTDAQRTYREITVLHQLNHQNIIKLERVIKAKNNRDLYLVTEFMEADLHSLLGQNVLEIVHYKYIIYQILKGLKYIHSADIIHRDLKPSNVLINSECLVKLCDFGLVRSIAHTDQQVLVLSEEVATRWYRSPEILLGCKTYGKAADMWSVGCIIAQMLNGQPLFPGTSTLDQLEKIIEFTGKPFPEDINSFENNLTQQLINQVNPKKKPLQHFFSKIPQEFIPLLVRLLHFNPAKRPTVQQALNTELLADFRNQQDEPICEEPIILPVNDNIKLGLKKYRQIIYEDILNRYPENKTIEKQLAKKNSIQKKKTSVRSKKSYQSSLSQKKQQSYKKTYLSNLSIKKEIKRPWSNILNGENKTIQIQKYLKTSNKLNTIKKHTSLGIIENEKKILKNSKQKTEKTENNTLKPRKRQVLKKCTAFEEMHKLYKYLK